MDIFVEYIVKRKKGKKEYVKIAAIVVAAIVLAMLTPMLMLVPVVGSLSVLCTAAVIFGAYYLITSLNVEYEYILTNGELDVDTIINRRNRKRLITVQAKNFEILAPVGTDEYKNEENGRFTRVIDASSANIENKAYFAVFNKDGQRIKLVFEPTEKMLDVFETKVPRNVKR